VRAEQMESEARAYSDRLLLVIDNTSAVIYIRDVDGRYLLVNRQYEQLFNLTRDDLVGLTDYDLFPKPVADTFRANDLKAMAQDAPSVMEETAPQPDGPHTYITAKYPIPDRDGHPYAVCGISTDITDRKRAEEQVRQLNAQLELRVRERTAELEASTRELDAFAYSVSHDLRAPLRALNGFSQALLEDLGGDIDPTGQDYLRRIRGATDRMGVLIDDLLELSRATRAELHRQPVDLSSLASKIIGELLQIDTKRQLEVIIHDGLTCMGDPDLLMLVMQNLLSNAFKFTSKRFEPRIEVGAVEGTPAPTFYVKDNGAGFDMAYADKLFDPFQRLHTAADFSGSGVGMAIVARIIARHGGHIWAEGEPNRGATFYFTVTPERAERRSARP
jgi:PAS domain S-box-containing protein